MKRRATLKLLATTLASASLAPGLAFAAARHAPILTRPIPASGEKLPVIGMGTWKTFNVGDDIQLRRARTEVLATFFDLGGGMVDCSPMYGSSADVLGFALEQLGVPDSLFSAEKVWTRDGGDTRAQVDQQRSRWSVQRFDLIQVHNLVAWRDHIETLYEMKRNGSIGYIGITTSHGRRHDQFERVMQTEDLDFVQLTYNITHRAVEQRLLPLAREKGIAVIANRPYDGGGLIKPLKRKYPVPEWAEAFGATTWADFLLKFIVSHPAMNCAIPATTRVKHMRENMLAGRAPLPDAAMRRRMIRHIETL